jgi:hypothetical protein
VFIGDNVRSSLNVVVKGRLHGWAFAILDDASANLSTTL